MSRFRPSLWESTSSTQHFPSLTKTIRTDVAIIGGGITGLTLAKVLSDKGYRICLLERDQLASGTTGQSSAHLTTFWDPGYAELKQNYGLEAALGVATAMQDAIAYIRQHATSEAAAFRLLAGFLYRENEGQEDSVEIERKACEEVGLRTFDMPKDLLPFPILDGFGLENQAVFHPIGYLADLVEQLDAKNVRIFEHSPVMDFSDDEVETLHGKIKAKAVVHATHTPIGIHMVHTGVQPRRSYVLAGYSKLPVGNGIFWDTAEPYHYVRKFEVDGVETLIVGGADISTGDSQETEEQKFIELEAFAREKFGMHQIINKWSSQFYDPNDGLPFIGQSVSYANNYIATGFSGDGLTMGTAAGLMLAQLIDKGSHPWEDLFSPKRFSYFNKEFVKAGWKMVSHTLGDRVTTHGIQVAHLDRGEGTVHGHLLEPKAFYRDNNGQLYEMSAVCTHMKCVVHWNPAQKSFDCPCHGSRFSCEGKVIEGPALKDLPDRKLTEE